ncbi:hypothetical protein [Shinella sp.]|uniref:hypothetical protein n=1 Tax=Shinella sp. TaxID=1870904 RepID=UPI002583CBD2|nr:hypothetical protein [Shinella sp.]MCW5706106.1 hypothetical protein [Shinella sp.]
MTNDPEWHLSAFEDEDGAQIDAAIAFPDSNVEISIAAVDLDTAAARLASLVAGLSRDA